MSVSDDHHLIDAFQRPVNYLRLSVTDRCNLRCRYCAPSRPPRLKKEQLLTLEEMLRLVAVGQRLGITKVRLTGGEPLCRRGIMGFIERLHHMPGLEDISLTTNGTLLAAKGRQLKQAGLQRINISLDTLDKDKFRQLAGVDLFAKAWRGVLTAMELGFAPLKINTVVMRGLNDDEIEALAGLALRYPFHVRFIEYMPIGTNPHSAREHFMPVAEIEKRLRRMGNLQPIAVGRCDGPALRYRFEGAQGEIGLIGSMSAHFCDTCNRLRLTATGHLRPCLLADDQVEVLSALRLGATDQQLEALFLEALARKRSGHRLSFECARGLQTKMVNIGG